MRTADELANLTFRHLRRQEEGNVPASDKGELKHYIETAPLLEHASDRLDPTTDAPTLAEEARIAYAKAQYTGLREHRREFQRLRREWKRKARISLHREDLDRDEYETPASSIQSDLSTADRQDTADGEER